MTSRLETRNSRTFFYGAVYENKEAKLEKFMDGGVEVGEEKKRMKDADASNEWKR